MMPTFPQNEKIISLIFYLFIIIFFRTLIRQMNDEEMLEAGIFLSQNLSPSKREEFVQATRYKQLIFYAEIFTIKVVSDRPNLGIVGNQPNRTFHFLSLKCTYLLRFSIQIFSTFNQATYSVRNGHKIGRFLGRFPAKNI